MPLKQLNFRSLQESTRFNQLVEELLKVFHAVELDTGLQGKCCLALEAMLSGCPRTQGSCDCCQGVGQETGWSRFVLALHLESVLNPSHLSHPYFSSPEMHIFAS